MKIISLGLAFLLAVVCSQTQARTVHWHGFVSQGVIQAGDSNFVNRDGEVSLALTEVGLNASWQLTDNLRLAGQGIYLNGGNRYVEGVRLDYLLLDWTLISNMDWQLNLLAGRFKNLHWLYSSTRDVPHTRPSIILPQSVYYDIFRDVALGSDGLGLTAGWHNAWGEFDLNWSYGSSPISKGQMQKFLGPLATGKVEQDFTHQLSLFWRPSASQWQWGISLLDSDFRYLPADLDPFTHGKSTSQRVMLNALYSSERWELASELMQERVVLRGFFGEQFADSYISQGGYVQWRYFYRPEITFLARLDLFDRDKNDRSGLALERRSGGLIPRRFGYMDDMTLGLSWRLQSHSTVRIEFHRLKGTGRLAPAVMPDTRTNASEWWHIWAVQWLYWF